MQLQPLELLHPATLAAEIRGADLGAGVVDAVTPVEIRPAVVKRVDHLVRQDLRHLLVPPDAVLA